MKRCCPPQEVVGDPADVVNELVVVGVRQEGKRVCGVDGEQRDDARGEEVEGGHTLARVDSETDGRREEEDVAERIGGGDDFLGHRESREMNVRGDEKDPREEADSDRENERVDHACAVALWVTPLYQQEQAGDERRVDRQIDGVPQRWELDLCSGEPRIAVCVEVAGEEQELAEDEQQPGGPGLRTMQIDPDGDRN